MKKVLDIQVRDDIDIIKATDYMSFIDCGASKSVFKKDDLCYKIPIGYEELNEYSFTKSCDYPALIEDFNDFINDTVAYYNEAMVWSIGQIIFEIIVWKQLLELKEEGYDISGFATIKDYYIDRNGIPVIVQEYVEHSYEAYQILTNYKNDSTMSDIFKDINNDVLEALKDRGIDLVDIRNGNMACNEDGIIKLFDFGISKHSSIYDYETYENYGSRSTYNDYYEKEENTEYSF